MRFIQPQMTVLVSGDAPRGARITDQISQQQIPSGVTVEQLASLLAGAYSLCRDAQLETTGVEMRWESLEENLDLVAYIISENVHRRHLSKGQAAIVVAKARLLSKQTMRELAVKTGASATRVAQASVVLQYAPDLAERELSKRLRP